MNINDFKIGDEIIITRRPTYWSSLCCDKDGRDCVTFPFKCTIEDLKKGIGSISIKAGGYGWSLSDVVTKGIIELVKKEYEFIVGKWYNFTTYEGKYNLYAKYREVKNHMFVYGNDGMYISNGEYEKGSGIIISKMENPRLLTDLSEIQKYLPSGHVDLIEKDDKLTFENLVEGEYYYTMHTSISGYIFKYNKKGSYNIHCTYFFDAGIFDHIDTNNGLRLATNEEKQHLEACIKANKFIPKEEVMKSSELTELPKYWHVKVTEENLDVLSEWRFGKMSHRLGVREITGFSSYSNSKGHNPAKYTENFGQEITFEQFKKRVLKEPIDKVDDIPEYVECIKLDTKLEIGKIYKCKGDFEIGYDDCYRISGHDCLENSPYFKSYFKPSTKEAFDAQQKSQSPKEVSLVGRYLKYIGISKKGPAAGDYFRVDSMEHTGLFNLKDNIKNCYWKPKDVINGISKSFELMPEGFIPPLTVPSQTSSVKPTTVEKWSVGTYVVFLEDLGMGRKKGNFEEIIRYEPFAEIGFHVDLKKTKTCMLSREESNQIKWCATKEEAEAFVKTLIEPEIEIKADEIDIKININTMKYFKGKIAFKGKKGGDQIPVFSSDDIPSQIHGKVFIHKDYDIEFAEIVDFYKEYYVVRYKDSCGKYVQLGFREDVLENVPTVKDMSYEELLAECKRRYPVGTVYYCQHLEENKKIVQSNFKGNTECIRSYDAWGCVYDQGKWSEIVSEPDSVDMKTLGNNIHNEMLKSEEVYKPTASDLMNKHYDVNTMGRWLQKLPEPYRSNAFQDHIDHPYDNHKLSSSCYNMEDAIGYAWTWYQVNKKRGENYSIDLFEGKYPDDTADILKNEELITVKLIMPEYY